MDALDVIIRVIHERLGDIDRRVQRLERVSWVLAGMLAFGTAILKLSGCV